MKYSNIGFNSAFIADFDKVSDWYRYANQNKHWNLSKDQLKELWTLSRIKHNKKDSPLAGDSSENAGEI